MRPKNILTLLILSTTAIIVTSFTGCSSTSAEQEFNERSAINDRGFTIPTDTWEDGSEPKK